MLFLLDTGATNVALSERLAERIGLAARRLVIECHRQWHRKELADTPQPGGAGAGSVVSGVEASVLPGMAGDEVLLGMSFLKHLELQQQGDKLILRPPG